MFTWLNQVAGFVGIGCILAAAFIVSVGRSTEPVSPTTEKAAQDWGIVYLPLAFGHVDPGQSPPADDAEIAPDIEGWTDFSNPAYISRLALEPGGDRLWATSHAGALIWERSTGAYERLSSADGLLSNAVNDVAFGPHGDTWVLTADGVSHRHPDGRWTLYPRWDHRELYGLLETVSLAPDGTVYIAGGGGVASFSSLDGVQRLSEAPTNITDVAIASDGTLWATFEGRSSPRTAGGVGRLRTDGSWRFFSHPDGMVHHDAQVVFIDRDDVAWIGTADTKCTPESQTVCGGVTRITPDEVVTGFTEQDGLGGNAVHAIAQDRDGNLWFGGTNQSDPFRIHGLSRLAPDGSWTVIEKAAGEPLDQVRALLADERGAVWVNSGRHGLFDLSSGRALPIEADMPTDAYSAVDDAWRGPDGRIWFGTISGVLLREPDGTWRKIPMPVLGDLGSWRLHVESVAVDSQGHLWVGTRKGLHVLDPEADFARLDHGGLRSLDEHWVSEIEVAPDGSVWLGTRTAGAHHRAPGGRWTWYGGNALPDNGILDIEVDRAGDVWISTEDDHGLVRITADGAIHRHVGDDGPACRVVVMAAMPDGGMVFPPTDNRCGMFSLRDDKGRWGFIPMLPGMETGGIGAAAADADGRLWLGSTGLWGATLMDIKGDEMWRRFRTDTGLANGNVYTILPIDDPEHGAEVWFGSWWGISRWREAP